MRGSSSGSSPSAATPSSRAGLHSGARQRDAISGTPRAAARPRRCGRALRRRVHEYVAGAAHEGQQRFVQHRAG
jgi:hypothetical protein